MLKAAIQQFVGHLGYQIVRARPHLHNPFDLLSIIIRDELTRTSDFSFVQVGAHDGVQDDPLRPSILAYGLRGLLIEPIPDVFEQLKQNYRGQPGLIFEPCAVAEADGEAIMFRIQRDAPVPAAAQQLASFDRRNLTSARQGVPGLDAHIEQIKVPARSLRSLVTQHGLANPTAVVIDAEGYDDKIVRMTVASGIRPRVLMYEHVHLPPMTQWDCLTLLKSEGYRHHEVGMDTIAILVR